MKTSYLWLLAAFVLVFILKKGNAAPAATPKASNPNQTGTAATTTGTQSSSDPFWSGWGKSNDSTLNNTTDNVKQAVDATRSLYNGISGLFGGSSTATGKASTPATNGSGAGVPVVDVPADNWTTSSWDSWD